MNKTLSKAIIRRTNLRKKFLKESSAATNFSYNKQRNWCLSLLPKEKEKHFANLNEKDITDNKTFWQTIKPFLSEKTKLRGKIILTENKNLVLDYAEVVKCLNKFFSNMVKSLKIPKYEVEDGLHLNMNRHPTLKAISKYRNYPSIISIRRFRHQVSDFNFLASTKIQS